MTTTTVVFNLDPATTLITHVVDSADEFASAINSGARSVQTPFSNFQLAVSSQRAVVKNGLVFVQLETGQTPRLTEREIALCRLLFEGKTIRGIAREMGISRRTVSYYIHSLKQKFAVTSSQQVVARAMEYGLIG